MGVQIITNRAETRRFLLLIFYCPVYVGDGCSVVRNAVTAVVGLLRVVAETRPCLKSLSPGAVGAA